MTLIRNFTIIYLTYSPPIPKFPSIIHSTFSLHNRLQYKTAHKTQNFPTEKRERSPVPLIHLSFIHFPNIPYYFSTIPCTASTRSPGYSAASASLRNSPAGSPYPQEFPHNPSGFSAAAPAYSDHTGTCSCSGRSGDSP